MRRLCAKSDPVICGTELVSFQRENLLSFYYRATKYMVHPEVYFMWSAKLCSVWIFCLQIITFTIFNSQKYISRLKRYQEQLQLQRPKATKIKSNSRHNQQQHRHNNTRVFLTAARRHNIRTSTATSAKMS